MGKKKWLLIGVGIVVIVVITVLITLLLNQPSMRVINGETGNTDTVSYKEQGQKCETFVVKAFKKQFQDYIEKGRGNEYIESETLDNLTKELDAKTFAKFVDYNLKYDKENNTLTGEMELGMVTEMSYLLGVTGVESGATEVTCYYDDEGSTTKALANGEYLYANGTKSKED